MLLKNNKYFSIKNLLIHILKSLAYALTQASGRSKTLTGVSHVCLRLFEVRSCWGHFLANRGSYVVCLCSRSIDLAAIARLSRKICLPSVQNACALRSKTILPPQTQQQGEGMQPATSFDADWHPQPRQQVTLHRLTAGGIFALGADQSLYVA